MSILRIKLFWVLVVAAVLYPGASLFAAGVSELTFTINGGSKPLSVPYGSRLELAWSSKGATECAGDWTVSKLGTSGKQAGRVTLSRSFTIACSGTSGPSKSASIRVDLTSTTTQAIQPLPVSEQSFLRVLSPNGEEVWRQGETRVISWASNDTPFIRKGFRVDVIDDKGIEYSLPTSTVPWSITSYTWRIPPSFPTGIRYKARVRIVDRAEGDTSDSPFIVQAVQAGGSKSLPLPCGLLGDVNNDKVSSAADADRARFLLTAPAEMTSDYLQRADVDLDGLLSSADISLLNMYQSGLITTFPGCSAPGVSVDLRANGSPFTVSIPINSMMTLSWTSSGGRCLMDGSFFPPNGSFTLSVGGPSTITYTMKCFAAGSMQSSSEDSVVVSVEAPNQPPIITKIDAVTPIRAAQSHSWDVIASDPDGITLTMSMGWGDGTAPSSAVSSTTRTGAPMVGTFTHTFAASGIYLMTVTVTDRKNAVVSQASYIVVWDKLRTSERSTNYQFGAIFEGYRPWNYFTAPRDSE
ncbi:MAG: PKD domain-containing protein [bacterium]|nr:PKD domain-containing protein [bacterium]